MTIQTGRFDGRLKANSTPVMTAEPSVMVVVGRFIMNLTIAHSNRRHDRTDVRVTINAPRPKKHSDTMNAGMRAISTPYMFFFMLSSAWSWGEGDTNNLFSISSSDFLFVCIAGTYYRSHLCLAE